MANFASYEDLSGRLSTVKNWADYQLLQKADTVKVNGTDYQVVSGKVDLGDLGSKTLAIDEASANVMNAVESGSTHVVGLTGGADGQVLVSSAGELLTKGWNVYFSNVEIEGYSSFGAGITGHNITLDSLSEAVPTIKNENINVTVYNDFTAQFNIDDSGNKKYGQVYSFYVEGPTEILEQIHSELVALRSNTSMNDQNRSSDQFSTFYPLVYLVSQQSVYYEPVRQMYGNSYLFVIGEDEVGKYTPTSVTELIESVDETYLMKKYLVNEVGEYTYEPKFEEAPVTEGINPFVGLHWEETNEGKPLPLVIPAYDGVIYAGEGVYGYGNIYEYDSKGYSWKTLSDCSCSALTDSQKSTLDALFPVVQQEPEVIK